MNNSMFAIESVSLEVEEPRFDLDSFKEREQWLITLIQALKEVQETRGWSSLKTELLDDLPAELNKQLSAEAKKLNPDTNKLNRLSGELKWAERFADLGKLHEMFRVELQSVRQKLHGQTQNES